MAEQIQDSLRAQPSDAPCAAQGVEEASCPPESEAFGMSKAAITAFFDRLAPSWDDDLVVDDGKINCILDAAGVQNGCTVLDVACGTGVLFPFYVQRNVKKVTGVDISPEMVKIASGKSRDPRIAVICADIERLPVTERYDCCIVYNAFPHFPEPARLIEKLAAFLNPSGRLTIAHGMGIEALNRHHSGSASKVSRSMLSISAMTALLGQCFHVDTAISDDEEYIVSGTLLPTKRDGKA